MQLAFYAHGTVSREKQQARRVYNKLDELELF